MARVRAADVLSAGKVMEAVPDNYIQILKRNIF